jgi:hypothetical protein
MGIFGFPLIPSERSPAVRSKKNVAVRRRGGIHSYFCVAVLDEQTTSQEKETTGHHLSVLCAETETVHHLFSSVCGCPTDLGRTSRDRWHRWALQILIEPVARFWIGDKKHCVMNMFCVGLLETGARI